MANWTKKALSVISGLCFATFAAAMDVDLGNYETSSYIALDSLGRPILVGRTENPTSSIFAAAYRLNGTNLWTTTVSSSDPAGAYYRKPQVRSGRLFIPWAGATVSTTPNVGSIEINASNGSLVSESMTTGINSVGYSASAVSANGTVIQTGYYIVTGPPNFISSCLYQKSPAGIGAIYNYPGVAGINKSFDGVVSVPGSIYVVGHKQVTAPPSETFTFVTKIDPVTFAEVWTTEIHGPNRYSIPRGIIVDSAGNIFVGGTEVSILGDEDIFYAKLNNAGVLLSQNSYVWPASDETAYHFILGPGGVPALAGGHDGQFFISTATSDLSTVYLSYSPAYYSATCLASDETSLYAASRNNVIRVDAICQTFWIRNYPALISINGMASNGTSLFTAGQNGGNAQIARIDTLTGNYLW